MHVICKLKIKPTVKRNSRNLDEPQCAKRLQTNSLPQSHCGERRAPVPAERALFLKRCVNTKLRMPCGCRFECDTPIFLLKYSKADTNTVIIHHYIVVVLNLSDKIDMALSLLNVGRALRRDSVGWVFPPLRCIENRRHQTDFQLVFGVFEQVFDRKVLHRKLKEWFWINKALVCGKQNWKCSFSYISLEHVVRVSHCGSI